MTAPALNPATPHMRLQFGGSIGVPEVEVWSNGLAFRVGPEAPSEQELQQIADAVANPIQDFVTNINSQIATAVALKWVKASWVLSSGKNRDVNTALHEYATPFPRGAKASGPIWPQTYAITLRTDLRRGRGHAGRIYVPVCGPAPEGNTPYAPAAYADGLAVQFAALHTGLMTAINAVIQPFARNAGLVIHSRATKDGRPATMTDVTSCVVDRVADIQHRRTNRVPRLEGATADL